MSCKGYFSELFVVKRFNNPCLEPGVVLCSGGAATNAPTYARVYTQARRHGRYLLKRFVLDSRHPVGIFVLLRTR